jgi:hypothetical protein
MTRPALTRAAARRPVLLGAAWTASAAAAIGLGFLAVSLVDASASPGTSPLAATTSSSAGPTEGSEPPAPTSTSPAVTGEHVTTGGTVYANCTAGRPVLAGVPAAGWWVDDAAQPGEVEFENGTQKVEVHVTCAGRSPQFSVEGPRADGSGRDDGTSTPASPSSSSPAPASATDDSGRDDSGGDDSGGEDSSGHGGGGHGSDDGSGDDSSGRGGGGHGSDD